MLLARNMDTMIPWLSPLIEENRHLLRDDWWPYGIEANRKALDTFLRYHFEQGLSKRRLTCEDIFVPELLNTYPGKAENRQVDFGDLGHAASGL